MSDLALCSAEPPLTLEVIRGNRGRRSMTLRRCDTRTPCRSDDHRTRHHRWRTAELPSQGDSLGRGARHVAFTVTAYTFVFGLSAAGLCERQRWLGTLVRVSPVDVFSSPLWQAPPFLAAV